MKRKALLMMTAFFMIIACERKARLTLTFFYLEVCPSCKTYQRAENILSRLSRLQSESRYIVRQTYQLLSKETKELFLQHATKNKVPGGKRYVPILFVDDRYFYGYDEIEGALSEMEEEYL